VAYQPAFAGGASLLPSGGERLLSRPVVAGAACRPFLAGGVSLLPLGAGYGLRGAGEAGAGVLLLCLYDIVERG